MFKSILKEIIIILLLCTVILFILSILFYDYNPLNKVVPNKIAYSVPENIRNELQEDSMQEDLTIENKVYKIEGSDLNIYKKSHSYNPSKENPFASTQNGSTNTNISNNTIKETSTNENTNDQTQNIQTSNTTNTNNSSNKTTGLK